MAETSDTLLHPFEFSLSTLIFVTSSGQQVDLRPIFVELNVYQDLFANIMSGNLIVTDSTNIFAYMVQQGSEFLHVIFDKPGLNQPFDKWFRVYNKKILQSSPSNQTIQLNFCSQELLDSKSIQFSKIYNNLLISDMIKDIARNVLKTTNLPDKNIEPTLNINTISVPHLNPFQAINWLSSKATSTYVGASFLFWENSTGFNFKSLQNLMDITGPKATYNYNTKNINDNDMNLDFYDVSRYQIIKTPDTLEGLMTGKFSGTLLTLDVLRQKFTIGQLNGDDLFNSSVSLGNGKAYNNYINKENKTQTDSYGSFRKFYPTNSGQNLSPYIQGKQKINPTNVENWLMERNAQIMQILGNRIKIVIPGNQSLNVGDVIQFNVPSIELQQGSNENETIRKLDPYQSGLWLISAIRHRITLRMFESIVELCRDTMQQSFPSADNTDSFLQGLS